MTRATNPRADEELPEPTLKSLPGPIAENSSMWHFRSASDCEPFRRPNNSPVTPVFRPRCLLNSVSPRRSARNPIVSDEVLSTGVRSLGRHICDHHPVDQRHSNSDLSSRICPARWRQYVGIRPTSGPGISGVRHGVARCPQGHGWHVT
jgi:hypothetical protein